MDENPDIVKKPVRTLFLKVLCILTFIGSGMNMVSYLFLMGADDEMKELLATTYSSFPEMRKIIDAGFNFFLANLLFSIFSLWGAIRMWHLKKTGFHIYTAAQIFLLIIPHAFLDLPGISFGAVMLTLSFVSAYATQLKTMR